MGEDVAVHFLRGEGNVEIVGNESGLFIGEMKIGFAEVGEEETKLHAQEAAGRVPPPGGIHRREANVSIRTNKSFMT